MTESKSSGTDGNLSEEQKTIAGDAAKLAGTQVALPVATVRKRRRWIAPLFVVAAAVTLAAVLYSSYVVKRGLVVTLTMDEGYGIKAGSAVRCRGIDVGVVETVRLSDSLDGVEAHVRLAPTAKHVARAGTLWWVVRPRLALTGIGGLETITGARYIEVVPGAGDRQIRFAVLEEPPPLAWLDPAGLEITLNSSQRGSLAAGSPVVYRQHRIGTVLSVKLARDATSSEVRAYIEPQYVTLIRENSRFWEVSGLAFHFGLTSFRIELESLQSLLDGGVAVATPDLPGNTVTTGHRFELSSRAEDEWLEWRPPLAVGAVDLPVGVSVPEQLRATVAWEGKWLRRAGQQSAWVLPAADGIWGPKVLLTEQKEGAELAVDGLTLPLAGFDVEVSGKLAFLRYRTGEDGSESKPFRDLQRQLSGRALDPARIRAMSQPEECVVFLGSGVSPIKLDPGSMEADRANWRLAATIPFSPDLHQGAPVVAIADGGVVGQLIIEDGEAFVAPLGLQGESQ